MRFDYASITNTALEDVAKQHGMTANDIANQSKVIVSLMMMELNNPKLTQQVTSAVITFINDQKSLEIVANPGTPAPFALLAAKGTANLKERSKTLSLIFTTNQ